jgi:hypothetical protein
MTESKKAELIFNNYKLVAGKIDENKEKKIEDIENYREDLIFMSPNGDFYKVETSLVFNTIKTILIDECTEKEKLLYVYSYEALSYNKIEL